MSEPYLVEVERSGFVESTHLVDVAVVDRSGTVVAGAGEPMRAAAFRSSAKLIQARVAREAGWRPADDAALAIACASHSGSPEHVAAVREVLRAAGIDEEHLACPPDLPLDPDAAAAAGKRARITHNCSGKHAGMLAACAAAGWPLEGYRDRAHPLQERVAARMRELLGDPAMLVDGCGVPTFVAPLAVLAHAFLLADDGPERAAMRAEPFLVGGTGRIDTDLMRAAPLTAKGGAEALLCVSDGTHGVAVKARDGGRRPVAPVACAVLEELGMIEPGAGLDDHRAPSVLGGGEPVGAVRARGALDR